MISHYRNFIVWSIDSQIILNIVTLPWTACELLGYFSTNLLQFFTLILIFIRYAQTLCLPRDWDLRQVLRGDRRRVKEAHFGAAETEVFLSLLNFPVQAGQVEFLQLLKLHPVLDIQAFALAVKFGQLVGGPLIRYHLFEVFVELFALSALFVRGRGVLGVSFFFEIQHGLPLYLCQVYRFGLGLHLGLFFLNSRIEFVSFVKNIIMVVLGQAQILQVSITFIHRQRLLHPLRDLHTPVKASIVCLVHFGLCHPELEEANIGEASSLDVNRLVIDFPLMMRAFGRLR